MSQSEDNEMYGCQSHSVQREGTCVKCYPDWMFERTGQFCLRHYLHYPNVICARALFCHVATVVPPESTSGYRFITGALRSLCLSIVHQGCGFSVRRWLRNFRTSFVARSIRYRGESFWRVYPDMSTGPDQDDVSDENRLKDWRQACAGKVQYIPIQLIFRLCIICEQWMICSFTYLIVCRFLSDAGRRW